MCINIHCIYIIGCTHLMSRKWRELHDKICEFKVIPCDRLCGDNVLRGQLDEHKLTSCPLRPVECPYLCIGCKIELLHKDKEEHLIEATQMHLFLAVERIQEMQMVLGKMTQQLLGNSVYSSVYTELCYVYMNAFM